MLFLENIIQIGVYSMNPLKEYLNSLKTPESQEIESMEERLMAGEEPFFKAWEIIVCDDTYVVAIKRALYSLVSTSKKRVKMPSGARIVGNIYDGCENGEPMETPDIVELKKIKSREKTIYALYEATTADGSKYLLYEGFHSDYDEIW